PIGCTVDFRGRLIHIEIILLNKLLMLGLCNKAISNYEGAVLLVSHDLSFVEKCGIVDSIYLN
ncbi:hypothetical protein ACG9XX_16220, partial [Acinetobacter baumannii]